MKVALLDIEGTTIPVTFVHDVLFPYARARLPAHVAEHPDDPDVAALSAAHGGPDGALRQLLAWMDADAKVTSLKALQGRLWARGYADGTLRAALYPDVLPRLRAWRDAGVRLAVFSSGSVPAQQLLYGHTTEGDLRGWFEAWFDTTVGSKREPESYAAIARALAVAPMEVGFFSDVEAELDAAAVAGTTTVLVARDGQVPSGRHAVATAL